MTEKSRAEEVQDCAHSKNSKGRVVSGALAPKSQQEAILAYIEGIPTITAYMSTNGSGESITKVMRDGEIIKEFPTPPSQIRQERRSLLWVVGHDFKDKTFERQSRRM